MLIEREICIDIDRDGEIMIEIDSDRDRTREIYNERWRDVYM